MPTGDFSQYETGLDCPAAYGAAVTPDDNTDLTTNARALYIGGAGNVVLITTGGNTLTFVGLLAGSILPVRTKRVKSNGTTATFIVALW